MARVNFLPRDATQSAVNATVPRYVVCPSVCPSVMFRYRGRDHIGWNSSCNVKKLLMVSF